MQTSKQRAHWRAARIRERIDAEYEGTAIDPHYVPLTAPDVRPNFVLDTDTDTDDDDGADDVFSLSAIAEGRVSL